MFCIVKEFESLGYAKVIESTGATWKIEYFDSPNDKKNDVRSVSKSRVDVKKLGANTRIFYLHESTGQWIVGRVQEDMGDGVEVRFADRNDVFIKYEQLFVRCKIPIADPVDYLANAITETPQFADARSGFMASYIAQRGSSWGISALLSSVIELEPHQINVVRRILSDPSQRYLLADEVGLGKTIEAGVVIRQAVLDDPRNHRVVILVPRSLIQQWRQELVRRFGLLDYLDISVFVVPQDSLGAVDAHLTDATLLVVDEAHHVASGVDGRSKQLYEIVRAHSLHIERLLLLSATPVLRNESGFLRMLHLLDPIVYNLNDEDGFRTKINHRQMLAEVVASLDPQNALYLDAILDDLIQTLPMDERLFELVSLLKQHLVGLPDENDPELIEAIRILRAHVSETYRLHRRILRNRRKQVTGLTPNRAGGRQISVSETQLARLESLLETWRINATSVDYGENELVRIKVVDFFWDMVNTLVVDPGHLEVICDARIALISKSPVLTFDGEASLLRDIKGLFDHKEWLDKRIYQMRRDLSQLISGNKKIVIFCSSELIADAVFDGLRVHMLDAIVRHEIGEHDENGNDELSWATFNTNPAVKLIVCDQRAEEGINLQGGQKIVFHFDLPLEPNRIEQRMGRVDRYGAGSAIESIVMIDTSSKYQSHWYSLLNDALDVFGRSISSLQYLIEDQMQQLKLDIFTDGIEAFETLTNTLSGAKGSVAKELKLIDQQDGLDELSQLAESDIESIFDIDSEWIDIRRTALFWACDTLLFNYIPEPKLVASLPSDAAFRFQYKVPGNGGQVTLMALLDFLGDFLGVIDYEDPRSSSTRPLTYAHCARRQSAVKNGARLLRYGDDFIEALKSFSDMDDRGRSYAMWRQVHEGISEIEHGMYFRFDFLIETSLDDAEAVLKEFVVPLTDTASSAISRRGDALFSPLVVQVWIDEEGDEPSLEFIDKYLTPIYDKHGKSGIYIDTNLKSLRFRSLMEMAPDTFSNWGERCIRMRDKAMSIILGRTSINDAKVEAVRRARVEDEIREAQLTTRIRMLLGQDADAERKQLKLETMLNAALYRGIDNPFIKVDVAGVVILSSSAVPTLVNVI